LKEFQLLARIHVPKQPSKDDELGVSKLVWALLEVGPY
jgi:hypothetical protein